MGQMCASLETATAANMLFALLQNAEPDSKVPAKQKSSTDAARAGADHKTTRKQTS